MHGRFRALLPLFLTLALWSIVLPIAPPTAAAENVRSFRDLGYTDTTARMIDSTASFYFPIPTGQTPTQGTQLEVVFSHSPLLIPERSTMTIATGGQSLTSIVLNESNRTRATISLPLPTENFTGSGYTIDFLFHMRLTREECEEATNAALWTTIHSDSRLILNTQPAAAGPQLTDVDNLFVPPAPSPQAAQSNAPKTYPPTLSLVVPTNPSPEELEAAGLVAYGAGQWATQVDRDPVIELANQPSTTLPSVIVGTGAALPDLGTTVPFRWDGQNFVAANGPIPGQMGALGIGQTETGTPRLVVSGGTGAQVRTAATALVGPEVRSLLTGNAVGISGNAATGLISVPPWKDGAASFAQLGFDRRQVTGNGEHTIDFAFERPAGWTLRDGATLDLQIATSPALRPETSWVAVSINGHDIGGQRLTGGDNGRYRFTLPNGLFNTDQFGIPARHLALQIRMMLDLPQERCVALAPGSSAWMALLPTSVLALPNTQASGIDLARFPYPLTGTVNEGIAVVIPQNPTPDDLAAGVTVLAAIGRHTATAIPTDRLPKLVTADRLSDADRKGRHLILVGGPDRNSVSAAAAGTMSNFFTIADPAVYRPGQSEQRGTLRVARSPFSNNHSLIGVLGNNPAGIKSAANALLYADTITQLHGLAAVVSEGVAPQTVTPAENPGTPPTALAPTVQVPLRDRFAAWQIIGAIGFVALLLALLLIIAARFRRRRNATS